jgi:hypothetical protein
MRHLKLFPAAALMLAALSVATTAQPEVNSQKTDDSKPDIHGTLLPIDSGLTLGAKDFTADLPEGLRDQESVCRTATIKVDKKVAFEVIVHYDQLVKNPNYFRMAEVTLPRPVEGVTVGVVFGFPTNLGTAQEPLMAVPFTLQWAGNGWLRGEQWTLYANGRLEKTE